MEVSSRNWQVKIRTPDQRLRVFVSSTLKELAEERAAAREAISRLRLAPVMFELGARPHAARNVYRAYLEQSHVFLGIYAEQYGWVAPGMTISGLEEEYRLAGNRPKLIYIKTPASNRDPRLEAMLTDIRDHDSVSYRTFSSADELRELVEGDIALLLTEYFEMSQRDDQISIPASRQYHVPMPPTPLIGREREVATACELLVQGGVRLLTLTGPGGSGKTRLGIEVARRLVEHFRELYFVELAALTDPKRLADAIAHALGLGEVGARAMEERLSGYLRDRQALLVLDNFEQIVAAAPLVAMLLENCPRLKVLVTSRMPLRLRGEKEFPVLPLPVPALGTAEQLSQNEAVQLFIQRAVAVKPDFTITEENAPILAEICRRLDGLPLAIELAAARIRLLPPKAILVRLEQRLRFLQGGPRDLPRRQQTIRDTIAWSYDLLDTGEATLFRRLSVFAGGCTLEAAEAVGNPEGDLEVDTLGALEALVSKNLIRTREDLDGEPRFDMLGTIREFALEQLSTTDEARDVMAHHAAFFVNLAEEAELYLTSGQRDPWLARLQAEIDNVRMVLSRSLGRQTEPLYGLRLAGTLGWFWHLRGHLSEGRSWASSLIKLSEATGRTRARAKVLFPAGGLAWSQGDYETATALLEESAAIFEEVGDIRGLTDARGILAGSLASLGQYDRALALSKDTAALLREKGDRWGLAFTLYWLGSIVLVKTGDAQAAHDIFKEILAISEDMSDAWLRADALDHLGIVTGLQGDYRAARAYFEEGLTQHQAIGDRWAMARSLYEYGNVMLRDGDAGRAKVLFRESAVLWREMGNHLGLLACLGGLAQVAAAEGQAVRAARLRGAAPEPVRTIGWLFLRADPSEYSEYEKSLVSARKQLGEDAWNAEYQRGRAMPLEQALDYALSDA